VKFDWQFFSAILIGFIAVLFWRSFVFVVRDEVKKEN